MIDTMSQGQFVPLPPPRYRETMVRVYRTTPLYVSDAESLARERWQVAAVDRRPRRSGLGRILCLPPIAMIVRPRPEIVVTYSRAVTAPGTRTMNLFARRHRPAI
ncbi:MAG: hypothetical protein AVDCRST_MAG33-1921 [uncultured Thermomicrobiales bacterium]|uniref:Uncharacterized protein n=1 Tax=uncultured Thermomicrobiales bacterium TaxID=1645740 RepID=A0A6J4V102_9BACT|nr:MAG: hypothetical protein AVDCRST_MAG33-1921 [uncultured Thermomicrobiales bacterium]